MGGLFPKQDGPLSYQPRYPLLLAGETSSYFSYFHGSLNSLASAGNHWVAALRGNVRAVTSRQQKPLIANVTFILLLGQLNGAGR